MALPYILVFPLMSVKIRKHKVKTIYYFHKQHSYDSPNQFCMAVFTKITISLYFQNYIHENENNLSIPTLRIPIPTSIN